MSKTTLDNNDVPSNATESLNVSEDKKHGGVMAWVIPNNKDNTKYDLYIGSKDGVIANEDSSYLFYNFRQANSINFNNSFDTSNVTNMGFLFSNCTNLKSTDLSNFNTSKVNDIQHMFRYYLKLTFLNLCLFNTNKVTNMTSMFRASSNLTQITVGANWTTKNATTDYMFTGTGTSSVTTRQG